MAGRMEADFCIANLPGLAIGDGLKRDVTKAMPHHRGRGLGRKVTPHAAPCVVRMSMRNQRPVNRPPRVNIKAPSRAKDTLLGERQNWRFAHTFNLSVPKLPEQQAIA
jgi:hypothetical protein